MVVKGILFVNHKNQQNFSKSPYSAFVHFLSKKGRDFTAFKKLPPMKTGIFLGGIIENKQTHDYLGEN